MSGVDASIQVPQLATKIVTFFIVSCGSRPRPKRLTPALSDVNTSNASFPA